MTSTIERRVGISSLPGLLGLLLLTAGCTGLEPKGNRPDPASVGKIRFGLAPDTLEGLPAGRRNEMAEQVGKNLRGWGYRIETGPAASGYSHVMEARVGEIRRAGTPAGFSFSLGNSDPRALDFQKADVLPVDCILYPAGRPGDKASLYMDFVATDKLKAPGALADSAVAGAYLDHIATVCFNLLEDLKIKRERPAASAGAAEGSSTPAWFPEVRVEVREKKVTPQAAAPLAPAPEPIAAPVPTAKTQAAPPAATPPVPAPTPTEAASAAAGTAVPEAPPVISTETATDPGTGRKEMIIHNQGNPIILEFGYERK